MLDVQRNWIRNGSGRKHLNPHCTRCRFGLMWPDAEASPCAQLAQTSWVPLFNNDSNQNKCPSRAHFYVSVGLKDIFGGFWVPTWRNERQPWLDLMSHSWKCSECTHVEQTDKLKHAASYGDNYNLCTRAAVWCFGQSLNPSLWFALYF